MGKLLFRILGKALWEPLKSYRETLECLEPCGESLEFYAESLEI